MLRPLTLGRTIVNTELVRADVLLSNNDIIDVGGRQFLFLHAILNERLLSAAESGDIPKLQVLRYVLGPIRALTDPGSHSEVADLGCRSCCDFAPMSRSETGAFGPAGVALASDVSRLQSAPVPFPLANAHSHFPCGPHGSLRQLERARIASDQPGMYNRVCLNWGTPVLKGLTGRLRCPHRDGRTALILAARNGDVHVVELLIDAGANLNVTSNEGYGPCADCNVCAPS
jgi:hypothetical protein